MKKGAETFRICMIWDLIRGFDKTWSTEFQQRNCWLFLVVFNNPLSSTHVIQHWMRYKEGLWVMNLERWEEMAYVWTSDTKRSKCSVRTTSFWADDQSRDPQIVKQDVQCKYSNQHNGCTPLVLRKGRFPWKCSLSRKLVKWNWIHQLYVHKIKTRSICVRVIQSINLNQICF